MFHRWKTENLPDYAEILLAESLKKTPYGYYYTRSALVALTR